VSAARLRPSPDVVSSRVGDEVVLVDLRTDEILVLNATGARIWELIADGHDEGDVRARLLQEFAVHPAELDREVSRFVGLLDERRLVAREERPGGGEGR